MNMLFRYYIAATILKEWLPVHSRQHVVQAGFSNKFQIICSQVIKFLHMCVSAPSQNRESTNSLIINSYICEFLSCTLYPVQLNGHFIQPFLAITKEQRSS